MTQSSFPRLHVVDALRGFAIVSIMLLHNIEHFDMYHLPANLPTWMVALDKSIWNTLFFLFGGKSYAIFALLFGLTFFIQSDHQEKKGKDFRGRFAWRLVLLLGFGMINSCFYEGDILSIYAIVGFTLIPVAKWSNKAVFLTALLLMLQPLEWFNVLLGLQSPNAAMANPLSWHYFDKMGAYIAGNSFYETVVGNLTNGKLAVLNWTWENGRIFQTASLFMLGMLAGRKDLFTISDKSIRFWTKTILISILLFIPLFILKDGLPKWIPSEAIHRPLKTIFTSWSNLSFMLLLVSGFVLLFHKTKIHKVLNAFSLFGRMSLSNYVIQSILGSIIYYGFGLGLYLHTGATYSILIGAGLALMQWFFCKRWLAHHKQGPLEILWHKGTWIKSFNT